MLKEYKLPEYLLIADHELDTELKTICYRPPEVNVQEWLKIIVSQSSVLPYDKSNEYEPCGLIYRRKRK